MIITYHIHIILAVDNTFISVKFFHETANFVSVLSFEEIFVIVGIFFSYGEIYNGFSRKYKFQIFSS